VHQLRRVQPIGMASGDTFAISRDAPALAPL
jgi:hypothetical protein